MKKTVSILLYSRLSQDEMRNIVGGYIDDGNKTCKTKKCTVYDQYGNPTSGRRTCGAELVSNVCNYTCPVTGSECAAW